MKDWYFTKLTKWTRKTNFHQVHFIILKADLETSNVETETGIGESQKAKDDLFYV